MSLHFCPRLAVRDHRWVALRGPEHGVVPWRRVRPCSAGSPVPSSRSQPHQATPLRPVAIEIAGSVGRGHRTTRVVLAVDVEPGDSGVTFSMSNRRSQNLDVDGCRHQRRLQAVRYALERARDGLAATVLCSACSRLPVDRPVERYATSRARTGRPRGAVVRRPIRTVLPLAGSSGDAAWPGQFIVAARRLIRTARRLPTSRVPRLPRQDRRDVPADLDVHRSSTIRRAQACPREGVAGEAPAVSRALPPTYASWINQVERWFGIITERHPPGLVPQRGSGPVHQWLRRAVQHQGLLRLDRHRPMILAF